MNRRLASVMLAVALASDQRTKPEPVAPAAPTQLDLPPERRYDTPPSLPRAPKTNRAQRRGHVNRRARRRR